jgi:hypothetical protein
MTATIKKVRGEFVIQTEGFQVLTMLTKKSDLQKAITLSEAHKWLIGCAESEKANRITGSNQIPSTATQNFVTKAFYNSVKLAVEQMVELEGLSIINAIAEGNALMKGNRIVSNSDRVMETVKDALRYGKQAGVI